MRVGGDPAWAGRLVAVSADVSRGGGREAKGLKNALAQPITGLFIECRPHNGRGAKRGKAMWGSCMRADRSRGHTQPWFDRFDSPGSFPNDAPASGTRARGFGARGVVTALPEAGALQGEKIDVE